MCPSLGTTLALPGLPSLMARSVDGNPAVLAAMARGLRDGGAQVLAIACNTAHAYADDVRSSGLPLIDLLEAAGLAATTAGATRESVHGMQKCVTESGFAPAAFSTASSARGTIFM